MKLNLTFSLLLFLGSWLLVISEASSQEIIGADVRGTDVPLHVEPRPSADSIALLQKGDVIRVVGDAENGLGETKVVTVDTLGVTRTWFVPVEVVETGEVGWIAEQFIDPRELKIGPRLKQQSGLTPAPAVRETSIARGTSGRVVVGPALDLIPAGTQGELSIVATGAFEEGVVPVVLQNNTSDDLTLLEVTGEVRNLEGRVTQTVSGYLFNPIILRTGEFAIGPVYFDQPVAPTDVVQLKANGTSDSSYFESRGVVALELVEFNYLGDRITGSVRNPSEKVTTDNGYIQLMCFDADGVPLSTEYGAVDSGIAPGGIAAFEFEQFGTIPVDCVNYLFGAYSYTS